MMTAVLALVVVALLAGAALGAHMVFVAPRDLRLTTVDAPIAGLPPALEGFTIAVLADLHHVARWSRPHTRRAVELARAAKPDLVALLGDYGASFESSRPASVRFYEPGMADMTAVLRPLAAEVPTVAVLGNHDHYASAERTREWLASLGARVLVNEATRIERGGAVLVVGGVDDLWEGRVDPHGGCADEPNDAPTVVLSHNPDGVLVLSPARRIDLVLSGHTHGGQIVFPWLGAPVRHARVCGPHTASGWVPNELAPLYVSRGVGNTIPLRFRCPPEVVIVKLVKSGTSVKSVEPSGRQRVPRPVSHHALRISQPFNTPRTRSSTGAATSPGRRARRG